MRIAIIENDTPRESLVNQFGRYGQIYTQWLSPALPEADFTAFAAYNGEAMPKVGDFDGYLLTGSRYGVYDELSWMAEVIDLIRAARGESVPVAGICFGHQIMAKAYGGVVEKSSAGWVLGRETYSSKANPADQKSVFAIHQDQVITPPDGVTGVHGSGRVPYGRLEYDFSAFSVQYHPEFYPQFFRSLMQLLRGNVLSAAQADAAIASITDGADGTVLAQDFADFFRKHRH